MADSEISDSLKTLNVEGSEFVDEKTDTSKLSPTDVDDEQQQVENTDIDNNKECIGEDATKEDGEQDDEDREEQELKLRNEREATLSEEEKLALRDQGQELKESGNLKFKQQCYTDAVEDYTNALSLCPLCYHKERSIMHSNRAAAYMHLEQTDEVIKDCTAAVALHPHYPKPLLRRAQTYEKTDKLDEALEDYKKLLELDNRCVEALQACQRLPQQIIERNEKLKTEMLGKLKDLGNLCLRPFGLSTDNFQFQQNESGGYSVNFNQS